MGYRSEVRSVIYGEPKVVDQFLEDFSVDFEIVKGDSDLEIVSHDDYKVIHLHNDYCKWYDDYPVVQKWNDLMKKSQDFGLNYEFIRIGEDSDDMEEDCSPNASCLIGFSRQTVQNF
jgi:hypothetical protein